MANFNDLTFDIFYFIINYLADDELVLKNLLLVNKNLYFSTLEVLKLTRRLKITNTGHLSLLPHYKNLRQFHLCLQDIQKLNENCLIPCSCRLTDFQLRKRSNQNDFILSRSNLVSVNFIQSLSSKCANTLTVFKCTSLMMNQDSFVILAEQFLNLQILKLYLTQVTSFQPIKNLKSLRKFSIFTLKNQVPETESFSDFLPENNKLQRLCLYSECGKYWNLNEIYKRASYIVKLTVFPFQTTNLEDIKKLKKLQVFELVEDFFGQIFLEELIKIKSFKKLLILNTEDQLRHAFIALNCLKQLNYKRTIEIKSPDKVLNVFAELKFAELGFAYDFDF